MERIDLYIQEVGQHLPAKNRADIQKEIQSMIEDMLDDESRVQGKAPDDEMAIEILKRLGPPEQLAASYNPPRYLIGPKLYPHFIAALKIALMVIGILAMVGLGFSLTLSVHTPADIPQAIADILSSVFGALLEAFGVIVIVFSVLERTMIDLKDKNKSWDPRTLKAQPDNERVKFGSEITSIIFIVLALIVFNLYPQWIGVAFNNAGQWTFHPVLAPVFFSKFLPWFNILWVCQLVYHFVAANTGRQTQMLRWASVALDVCVIGLAVAILTGPAIVALDPSAIGWKVSTETGQTLGNLFNMIVRMVCAVLIVVSLVEVGQELYHTFRKVIPIERITG
jgi:hypothetical protein